MALSGRCNCGGVTFEVTAQPISASWCHCTRCQRRTGGAASPQTRLAPGSLRILTGEELLRAWHPQDGFDKVFCSSCGSSMWSVSPDGASYAVRFGVFDSDPGIRPSCRQFVAYAAPWDTIPDDGLPRYDERRPPDA